MHFLFPCQLCGDLCRSRLLQPEEPYGCVISGKDFHVNFAEELAWCGFDHFVEHNADEERILGRIVVQFENLLAFVLNARTGAGFEKICLGVAVSVFLK